MPLSQAQLQSLGFQQTGTNIHLVNDSILSYVDGNENGNIGQPGVYLFVLHIREDHRSVIYVGKAKRGLELGSRNTGQATQDGKQLIQMSNTS